MSVEWEVGEVRLEVEVELHQRSQALIGSGMRWRGSKRTHLDCSACRSAARSRPTHAAVKV